MQNALTLPDDTIVALATPPGMGAIAVVRLSGNQAFAIADRLFRGKVLAQQPSHTAHFGRIVNADGVTLDEVLCTVFRAPHSYTGQDTVEISCHGSVYIQQLLVQGCLAEGARLAAPGEFTLRAFLNGKLDLSQAEAVADLIASQSAAAHQVALRQLRGGFKDDLQALRTQLLHFAAMLELELDFSEEDVEFANRAELTQLVQNIRTHLARLLTSFALGNALKNGISTVIAGRPNAGKSTLLNALLNEERALVSDIPGTTRDTIEEVLTLQGIPFRLIDTAGIREAQDQIEALGVQRTFQKIKEAALVLYVWDVASGLTLREVHQDLAQLYQPDLRLLVVCNKMDRNPYFQAEWLVNPNAADVFPYLQSEAPLENHIGLTAAQIVTTAAKNQQNIQYLKEKIVEVAIGGNISLDHTIVTNARHYDALRRADEALQEVLDSLHIGLSNDLTALHLRHALAALGEITGEVGVEDLLGHIFSKFCIGK